VAANNSMPLDVINWLNCIWKTDLPSPSKLLAAYLRSFMNSHHDMAWPPLSRIESETGLARTTVCKHLEILESSGWIKRNRGHTGKATEYIATLPVKLQKAITDIDIKTISSSAPNELVHEANTLSAPNELASAPNEPQYPSNKQNNTQERAQLPRKERMTVTWTPDKTLLTDICGRSFVQPSIITPLALAEFATYWSEELAYFTEAQWIQKLIASAKKHALKNPVIAFPEKPDPDKPSALALKIHRELYPEQYANEAES